MVSLVASQVSFGPTASDQLTQQRWEAPPKALARHCCRVVPFCANPVRQSVFLSVRCGNRGRCAVQKDLSIDQPSERKSNSRALSPYGASADATLMNPRRRPFDSVTICLHCTTAVLVHVRKRVAALGGGGARERLRSGSRPVSQIIGCDDLGRASKSRRKPV
jgi:hypothetical protein